MPNYIYSGAMLSGGLIVMIGACLYAFQDKMIYQPNPDSKNMPTPDMNAKGYRNPLERGIPYEDVYVRTSDNLRLHMWVMKRPEVDAATIIYFHGNAGNIGFRLDIYEDIYNRVKVNVIAASYRGYGFSEGKPTEMGLYLDAEAIVQYALNCDLNSRRIYLFGASLGGAVVIYAAQKFQEVLLFRLEEL